MQHILLAVMLAMASTFAYPLPSQTSAFTNSPSCPNLNSSLGTQNILIPTINYGCQKPGGFCKRSGSTQDLYEWNVTAQDPSAAWIAGADTSANLTARDGDLLQRDQTGGIYICTQKQWAACVYNIVPTSLMGVCLNFCAGWTKKIQSIRPDAGMTCRIFSSPNCETSHWDVQKPGNPDTVDSWKVALQSMVCRLD